MKDVSSFITHVFFQGKLIVGVIIDGSNIYHCSITDLSFGHVDDDSAHEPWENSNAMLDWIQ